MKFQPLRLTAGRPKAPPPISLAHDSQALVRQTSRFGGYVGQPAVSLESWKYVSTHLRDGFISQCRPDANRSPHWSTSLLATTDMTSPWVAFSTTALSLLHVASMQRQVDLRVLHEARRAYGAAIVSVRRALDDASTRKVIPGDLVLGIELLGLYSEPVISSQPQTERTWDKHILASAELIQRMGAAAFDVSPTSQKVAVPNLQSVVFGGYKMFMALRRRMNVDVQALVELQTTLPGSIESIKAGAVRGYVPLFRFPELLERSDVLVQSSLPSDAGEIARLVQKLLRFSEGVMTWQSSDIFPKVARSSATDLDLDIEEHRFLSSRPMFQPWNSFSHWPHGQIATAMVSWISSLTADCATLRLLYFRCNGEESWESTVQAVRRNAYNTAAQMCRSIQSISRLDNLKYARPVHLLLAMAGAVFHELGAEEESDWCRDCQFATQARLRRLAPGQPRSLCRIEDVAPAIVNGVRFRTRDVPRPEDIIT